MGQEEWAAFAAAQRERWYRPPETEAAAPGLIAVRGADPEEYAPTDQALPAPPSPALGPPAAAGGLLAGIRRGLGFRTPPAPVAAPAASAPPPSLPTGARPPAVPSSPVASPSPSPSAEPPLPAAEGFEAEEEIAPGQFYARKKPKFAPP